MFGKITIRDKISQTHAVNLGSLCELLLFYGKILILTDFSNLGSLIETIGPDNLRYLVKNNFLNITYFSYITAAQTDNVGPFEYHNLRILSLAGEKDGNPWKNSQFGKKQIERVLAQLNLNPMVKKVLRSDVISKIEIRNDTKYLDQDGVNPVSIATDALKDTEFLQRAAKVSLSSLAPTFRIPNDYQFSVIPTDKGFIVDSNYDLNEINHNAKNYYGEDKNISHASILSSFWNAHFDLTLAGHYGSEILTHKTSSKLITMKVAGLLNRINNDKADLFEFSDFHFNDGFAIREAINSGIRSFDEFKPVLEKSRKFRHWIETLNPDLNLLKAYNNEVTADSWVDKLPSKTSRFAMLTSAGIGLDIAITGGLGTAAAVGISAADNFLLDRLIKGWKPDHYINTSLKPFINNS